METKSIKNHSNNQQAIKDIWRSSKKTCKHQAIVVSIWLVHCVKVAKPLAKNNAKSQ